MIIWGSDILGWLSPIEDENVKLWYKAERIHIDKNKPFRQRIEVATDVINMWDLDQLQVEIARGESEQHV